MHKTKGLLVILLLLSFTTIYSQNQIEYRSVQGRIFPEYPDNVVLIDSVVFTHKDMIMYCDSAIYNQKENYFDAYNNIKMYQGDSVSLFGDVLHYDGNTKIGDLRGKKVVMQDNEVTMLTDYIVLDRNVNTVSYYSQATIFNTQDTLKSKEGVYFIDDEVFQFYYDVRLFGKDGRLNSDSLFYNAKTNQSEFFGNLARLVIYEDTTHTDTTLVITKQGSYNTKTEEIYSYARPLIYTQNKLITADTLYYDKKNKKGYAYSNIYVEDTVEKMFLNANILHLNTIDTISTAIITDSLLLRQVDKKDTLYFHSDTIKVLMDTSFRVKDLFAFEHCKFFRSDMQGACEYAHYNRADSTLLMLTKPVLWAEESQLTADTIILLIDDKHAKQIFMHPNTFILQNSDTNTQEFFNQVNGKNLIGYFQNNKIHYAEIDGNTRSIYYLWDENKKQKTKSLTGVNVGLSKKMHLYFDKGELKKMSAIEDAEFYMDRLKNIPEQDRQLKGFINLHSDKPKQAKDIYIKRCLSE